MMHGTRVLALPILFGMLLLLASLHAAAQIPTGPRTPALPPPPPEPMWEEVKPASAPAPAVSIPPEDLQDESAATRASTQESPTTPKTATMPSSADTNPLIPYQKVEQPVADTILPTPASTPPLQNPALPKPEAGFEPPQLSPAESVLRQARPELPAVTEPPIIKIHEERIAALEHSAQRARYGFIVLITLLIVLGTTLIRMKRSLILKGLIRQGIVTSWLKGNTGDRDLIQYVRRMLTSGYPEWLISDQAKKAGHTPESIEQAFRAAKK